MEIKENTKEKIIFSDKMNLTLANAIRRSVNEIPVLAIDECDIYKNDSALYDEILAHRLGLIPLKNQKLKEGTNIELKLKAKGKEGGLLVMSDELGEISVYNTIPIVFLDAEQAIEIVSRANIGKGKTHAKYVPGLMFYKQLPKIKIGKEAESKIELAEKFPEIFEFKDKLKVKDASKCDLDMDDFKNFPGIEISFDDEILFEVESWGQMDAKEIVSESCKALKSNLAEVTKALK